MEKNEQTSSAFVQLPQPINCIPAGVYKVIDRDTGSITLAVGSKIFIGILGDFSSLVTPISRKEGKRQRMTTDAFVPKYEALLQKEKGKMTDPRRPFTFCLMDPSVPMAVH